MAKECTGPHMEVTGLYTQSEHGRHDWWPPKGRVPREVDDTEWECRKCGMTIAQYREETG